MVVKGAYRFVAPNSTIWSMLMDEHVLASCTPGCQSLTKVGPDLYQVSLKVGLAAVSGSYEGTFAIVDKQEPTAMTLKIDASGTAGFVAIAGRMDLSEENGQTDLVYDWDVSVGGHIAMVGQRVLGGVAKWIIGEFFTNLNKEVKRQAS
jgi:uncharacterized protein